MGPTYHSGTEFLSKFNVGQVWPERRDPCSTLTLEDFQPRPHFTDLTLLEIKKPTAMAGTLTL